MPNINISLPQRYAEALETKAIKGESLGLAAKRLLLALLDGEIETPPPAPSAPITTAPSEELAELKEKIAGLEAKLTRYILDDDSASGDDAESLAERLDDLALQIATIGESLNRTGPHGDQSVLINRVIELEKTLEPIALSYKNKLPLTQIDDRLAEIEKQLARREREIIKLLDERLHDKDRVNELFMRISQLEETVKSLPSETERINNRIKTIDEQLDYLTDLPQRIEFMSAALETFEEELESCKAQEPKRRGRPRKETE